MADWGDQLEEQRRRLSDLKSQFKEMLASRSAARPASRALRAAQELEAIAATGKVPGNNLVIHDLPFRRVIAFWASPGLDSLTFAAQALQGLKNAFPTLALPEGAEGLNNPAQFKETFTPFIHECLGAGFLPYHGPTAYTSIYAAHALVRAGMIAGGEDYRRPSEARRAWGSFQRFLPKEDRAELFLQWIQRCQDPETGLFQEYPGGEAGVIPTEAAIDVLWRIGKPLRDYRALCRALPGLLSGGQEVCGVKAGPGSEHETVSAARFFIGCLTGLLRHVEGGLVRAPGDREAIGELMSVVDENTGGLRGIVRWVSYGTTSKRRRTSPDMDLLCCERRDDQRGQSVVFLQQSLAALKEPEELIRIADQEFSHDFSPAWSDAATSVDKAAVLNVLNDHIQGDGAFGFSKGSEPNVFCTWRAALVLASLPDDGQANDPELRNLAGQVAEGILSFRHPVTRMFHGYHFWEEERNGAS